VEQRFLNLQVQSRGQLTQGVIKVALHHRIGYDMMQIVKRNHIIAKVIAAIWTRRN